MVFAFGFVLLMLFGNYVGADSTQQVFLNFTISINIAGLNTSTFEQNIDAYSSELCSSYSATMNISAQNCRVVDYYDWLEPIYNNNTVVSSDVTSNTVEWVIDIVGVGAILTFFVSNPEYVVYLEEVTDHPVSNKYGISSVPDFVQRIYKLVGRMREMDIVLARRLSTDVSGVFSYDQYFAGALYIPNVPIEVTASTASSTDSGNTTVVIISVLATSTFFLLIAVSFLWRKLNLRQGTESVESVSESKEVVMNVLSSA